MGDHQSVTEMEISANNKVLEDNSTAGPYSSPQIPKSRKKGKKRKHSANSGRAREGSDPMDTQVKRHKPSGSRASTPTEVEVEVEVDGEGKGKVALANVLDEYLDRNAHRFADYQASPTLLQCRSVSMFLNVLCTDIATAAIARTHSPSTLVLKTLNAPQQHLHLVYQLLHRAERPELLCIQHEEALPGTRCLDRMRILPAGWAAIDLLEQMRHPVSLLWCECASATPAFRTAPTLRCELTELLSPFVYRELELATPAVQHALTWFAKIIRTVCTDMPAGIPGSDGVDDVDIMCQLLALFDEQCVPCRSGGVWHLMRQAVQLYVDTLVPTSALELVPLYGGNKRAAPPSAQWNQNVRFYTFSAINSTIALLDDSILGMRTDTADISNGYMVQIERTQHRGEGEDSTAQFLYLKSDMSVEFSNNTIAEEANRYGVLATLLYDGPRVRADGPKKRKITWTELPGYYAPVSKYSNVLYFLTALVMYQKIPTIFFAEKDNTIYTRLQCQITKNIQLAMVSMRRYIRGNEGTCMSIHPSVFAISPGHRLLDAAGDATRAVDAARMVIVRTMMRYMGHYDCTDTPISWYLTNYRLFYQKRTPRGMTWHAYDGIGAEGVQYTNECPSYRDETTLLHSDNLLNMDVHWPMHSWANVTDTPYDRLIEEPPLHAPHALSDQNPTHVALQRVLATGLDPGVNVPEYLFSDPTALVRSAQMYGFEPVDWTFISPLTVHIGLCLLTRGVGMFRNLKLRPFWRPSIPRKYDTLMSLFQVTSVNPNTTRILLQWTQQLSVLKCNTEGPRSVRLLDSCSLVPAARDAALVQCESRPLSVHEIARMLSSASYMCLISVR